VLFGLSASFTFSSPFLCSLLDGRDAAVEFETDSVGNSGSMGLAALDMVKWKRLRSEDGVLTSTPH
jgi:hypothetical protein